VGVPDQVPAPHALRNLYRALVKRLGEIRIDPMDVSVVVLEPKLDSLGAAAVAPPPTLTWASRSTFDLSGTAPASERF
jgi:hypothetical protein